MTSHISFGIMVKIFNSNETVTPVYKNRRLYEGQLVCYNSRFVNGTGSTECFCYINDVLGENTYQVKEIKEPKSFNKAYNPPTPREFILDDLDQDEMYKKIGSKEAFIEYLVEITPKDVERQYGKRWEQILEYDTNLKKKKIWKK